MPSGQSHQLSTGTVKKPTSPVGFFTSEVSQ
ncbi:conjugal transfer protein TraP, partial [Salmonella enterica subsp. enterica serovar Brunei]|nr:conjugal transfer protein TraP [Salmonella enterica subsp. enterica serovar Brunei]